MITAYFGHHSDAHPHVSHANMVTADAAYPNTPGNIQAALLHNTT
jgi:hypothetical protein